MGFCRFPIRAAVAAVLLLPVLGSAGGCGPAASEVDSAARYTPESLAQELAFRYRALTPEAKKAPSRNRAKSKTTKSIAQLRAPRSSRPRPRMPRPRRKAASRPSTICSTNSRASLA